MNMLREHVDDDLLARDSRCVRASSACVPVEGDGWTFQCVPFRVNKPSIIFPVLNEALVVSERQSSDELCCELCVEVIL
jgi:hypothetical protein